LMNTCALSRHEAELLVRLHAGMKSMQPPAAASRNEKPASVAGNASRANTNLNQLKNIGDRNKAASKPATTSLASRPATSLRPAAHQRVSLVG
ncbi:MAG: hypothetical protein ABUL52_01525, partial [Solimonas sp.]